MIQATRALRGRPVPHGLPPAPPSRPGAAGPSVLPSGQTPASADKWAVLADVTALRRGLDLSDRTVSVLQALLSFLPGRAIPAMPSAASVVFPANRSLSERLGAMPDSTLRRHLARLVAAGLIDRRASPNNKRFARRVGGTVAVAFGLDLSPLARRAAALRAQAERLARDAEERRAIRAQVLELRHLLLCEMPGDPDLLDLRTTLRRDLDIPELRAILEALSARHDALFRPSPLPSPAAPEACPDHDTSASDSRNERHQQRKEKDQIPPTAKARPSTLTMREVLDACPERRAYFPSDPHDERELERMTDRLAPMMGIRPGTLDEARRRLGGGALSAVVLLILQLGGSVRHPDAYLARLALEGPSLSLESLLRQVRRRETATAAAGEAIPA